MSSPMSSPPWAAQLEDWLEPFVSQLGRAEQRHWAPLYVRGLLLPGERKSVEPLAQRVCPGDVQQLHHFLSTSPWESAALQQVLIKKADRLLGGAQAALIVDDTATVKQGRHSVGVSRQYCGELGKRANCQVLVTLTLARAEVPLPVWMRLFLPEAWASDPPRCRRAGVPEAEIQHRPKWEIALQGIDEVLSAGARFGWLTADAEYGKVPAFRHGLTARGLRWAVGIEPQQHVYPADVVVLPPPLRRRGGPAPKHPVPSVASQRADATIAALGEDAFEEISWRRGTKGPLKAKFVALRVRVAEGARIARQRRLPAPEVLWLVCEWRATGERKYYLCNHPPQTGLRTLARHIKARWSCEQAHEQMKNELGLDHLECRNWRALQHHTLLVRLAFAFLQHLRLGGEKAEASAPEGAAAPALAS